MNPEDAANTFRASLLWEKKKEPIQTLVKAGLALADEVDRLKEEVARLQQDLDFGIRT